MKALSLLGLALLLAGCGADSGPDPAQEASRLRQAQSIRSLFDKAHGDYTKLSPADREAFVKSSGGDPAKAEEAWNAMKYGSAAAPDSKGASHP